MKNLSLSSYILFICSTANNTCLYTSQITDAALQRQLMERREKLAAARSAPQMATMHDHEFNPLAKAKKKRVMELKDLEEALQDNDKLELNNKGKNGTILQFSQQMETLNLHTGTLLNMLIEEREERAKSNERLEALEKAVQEVGTENRQLKKENKELRSFCRDFEIALNDVKDKASILEEENQKLRRENETLQGGLGGLKDETSILEDENQKLKTENETLKRRLRVIINQDNALHTRIRNASTWSRFKYLLSRDNVPI